MNPEQRNQMIASMEQAKDGIAALNGLKNQLIEAGWDENNAEQMVIALVATGSNQ